MGYWREPNNRPTAIENLAIMQGLNQRKNDSDMQMLMALITLMTNQQGVAQRGSEFKDQLALTREQIAQSNNQFKETQEALRTSNERSYSLADRLRSLEEQTTQAQLKAAATAARNTEQDRGAMRGTSAIDALAASALSTANSRINQKKYDLESGINLSSSRFDQGLKTPEEDLSRYLGRNLNLEDAAAMLGIVQGYAKKMTDEIAKAPSEAAKSVIAAKALDKIDAMKSQLAATDMQLTPTLVDPTGIQDKIASGLMRMFTGRNPHDDVSRWFAQSLNPTRDDIATNTLNPNALLDEKFKMDQELARELAKITAGKNAAQEWMFSPETDDMSSRGIAQGARDAFQTVLRSAQSQPAPGPTSMPFDYSDFSVPHGAR